MNINPVYSKQIQSQADAEQSRANSEKFYAEQDNSMKWLDYGFQRVINKYIEAFLKQKGIL